MSWVIHYSITCTLTDYTSQKQLMCWHKVSLFYNSEEIDFCIERWSVGLGGIVVVYREIKENSKWIPVDISIDQFRKQIIEIGNEVKETGMNWDINTFFDFFSFHKHILLEPQQHEEMNSKAEIPNTVEPQIASDEDVFRIQSRLNYKVLNLHIHIRKCPVGADSISTGWTLIMEVFLPFRMFDT